MTKKTLILIGIIGIFGCSIPVAKKSLSENIKGDWKTEYFEGDWKKRTAFIFTFQDTTCTYLYPFGVKSRYKIQNDTLIINERIREKRNNISGGKEAYQFLIDSINTNSLYLKPITKETKKLFSYYGTENFKTFKLSRVKKINNWNFKHLGFYSTECFGTCPSMYMEIDSLGNIYFEGGMYTKKSGFHIGKLSKNVLTAISNKINNIQLDSLKEYYSANWTDDQTCGIKVETKNKIYESNAYGFDKEPIELRILFHHLIELYKEVDLKKDTIQKFKFNKFSSKGIRFRLSPPPLPPPPKIEK